MNDRWAIPIDDDQRRRRVARDGDRITIPMCLMDGNPILKGDTKMATITYTLKDGTERSVTTADATAAAAIDALSRENDGLRGEIAALHSLVHRSSPGPSNIADAAREGALRFRDHLRAQNAAQADPTTPQGARAQQLRDAWKTAGAR